MFRSDLPQNKNIFYTRVSVDQNEDKLVTDFDAIATGAHQQNIEIAVKILSQQSADLKLYSMKSEAKFEGYGELLIGIICDPNELTPKKDSWSLPYFLMTHSKRSMLEKENIQSAIPYTNGFVESIAEIIHSESLYNLHLSVMNVFKSDSYSPMLEKIPNKTPLPNAYILEMLCDAIFPGKVEYYNMFYNGARVPNRSTPRIALAGHESTIESVHKMLTMITHALEKYKAATLNYTLQNSVSNGQAHMDFCSYLEKIQKAYGIAFKNLCQHLAKTTHFLEEKVELNSNPQIEFKRTASLLEEKENIVPLDREIPMHTTEGGILEQSVNLSVYPQSHGIPLSSTDCLVLGDLHGNAIKLIYFLIHENIIQGISEKDYELLLEIYNFSLAKASAVTGNLDQALLLFKQKIDNFIAILAKMTAVNAESPHIILIGDMLADRGQNDYFTLKILQKLNGLKIFPHILLSNHDREFIRFYENNLFHSQDNFYSRKKPETELNPPPLSMLNFIELIKMEILGLEEVSFLVENIYYPLLTASLININQDDPNKFIYFSHAPVSLNNIDLINKQFKLTPENASPAITPLALKEQTVAIHKKAKELLAAKKFAENSPDGSALSQMMWQRKYDLFGDHRIKDNLYENWKVLYVHGHDGAGKTSIVLSPSQTTLDLDNDLGKDSIQKHGTYNAFYFGRNELFLTLRNYCFAQDTMPSNHPSTLFGAAKLGIPNPVTPELQPPSFSL